MVATDWQCHMLSSCGRQPSLTVTCRGAQARCCAWRSDISSAGFVAAGRSELEAAEEAQASGAADDAAGSRKRRARSGAAPTGAADGGGAPTAEQLKGAVQSRSQSLLAGHTQCVASVVWPTTRTAVSGSWDHSVSHLILANTAFAALNFITIATLPK